VRHLATVGEQATTLAQRISPGFLASRTVASSTAIDVACTVARPPRRLLGRSEIREIAAEASGTAVQGVEAFPLLLSASESVPR
jgi:hypothetical protein